MPSDLRSLSSAPRSPLPASPEAWTLIIRPHGRWWDLQLAEVWHYRDLLWMFIRRDFVSVYKQTILGPLWFFVQPLLTTLMFTVIFTGVAKISTDGLPPMLFYLAGTTPWNYFSTCLTKTAGTFLNNAGLFGKVYFPRLVTPISVVASNLIQFGIQFLLFFGFLAYYLLKGYPLHPNWLMIVVLTPVLLLLMALLGLGTGIIASSLTTKYRDLTFLLAFGVQLAMYATPVIYPMSAIPAKYRLVIELNPMSAIIETFRAIYLGPSPAFAVGDFKNFPALADRLKNPPDAVSVWLKENMSPATLNSLTAYDPAVSDPAPLEKALAQDMNALTRTNAIYTAPRFAGITLRPETQRVLGAGEGSMGQGAGSGERGAGQGDVRRLNRLLLEDAYPGELAQNNGGIPWPQLGVSALVTLVLLLGGIAIFNKVEKTFMDTV